MHRSKPSQTDNKIIANETIQNHFGKIIGKALNEKKGNLISREGHSGSPDTIGLLFAFYY